MYIEEKKQIKKEKKMEKTIQCKAYDSYKKDFGEMKWTNPRTSEKHCIALCHRPKFSNDTENSSIWKARGIDKDGFPFTVIWNIENNNFKNKDIFDVNEIIY